MFADELALFLIYLLGGIAAAFIYYWARQKSKNVLTIRVKTFDLGRVRVSYYFGMSEDRKSRQYFDDMTSAQNFILDLLTNKKRYYND